MVHTFRGVQFVTRRMVNEDNAQHLPSELMYGVDRLSIGCMYTYMIV